MQQQLRSEFFDSRDTYLSFVHTTDEKIHIAFYLARQLQRMRFSTKKVFRLLDAGTGEGTVIATFLTALHQRMPHTPIVAMGKEISIDDICILLSYLPDRFAEHKPLLIHLTNLTYEEINNLPAVKFKHIKKPLKGGTSHEFGLQLMNMAELVKKHWALSVQAGKLVPQQKVLLTLYRQDQQQQLLPLLAEIKQTPPTFDFIIASQPFRLRRQPTQVAALVIAPLLRLLQSGGRMVLVYSSGRDFSKPLLRCLYPGVRPYRNGAPEKLLTALNKLLASANIKAKVDSLRYGFVNLNLERRQFSLSNIFSFWKIVTYVGQVSETETSATPFSAEVENKIRNKLKKIKELTFVNNVIIFNKKK